VPAYGQLYNLISFTPTTALTAGPTILTFGSSGPSSDTTISAAAGTIEVLTTGTYVVSFDISCDPTANARTWAFQIFVNGVVEDPIHISWDATNNEEGVHSMSGILDLTANDIVTVRGFITAGANASLVVFAQNLHLWRID